MIPLPGWSALPARLRRILVASAVATVAIASYSAGELGLAAGAALAVVAILAGAAALGRRKPRSDVSRLLVVARAPLGRDVGVAVVVWRGAEILVGHAPSGLTVLGRHSMQEEVAP